MAAKPEALPEGQVDAKAGSGPDIRFRIVTWIGIINQLVSTKANRLLKDHGLPFPQFVLLNHFSHRPEEGKTVTGIARAMQQPQPGITKTIAKLTQRGFLEARPSTSDGRSKVVFMTAAGKAAHKGAVAILMPEMGDIFADWAEDDLMQLFAGLDAVKVYLDDNR